MVDVAAVDVQVREFSERGYLVLPGWLPPALVERLAGEVDYWVDAGWRQQSIDACLRPVGAKAPKLVELDLEAHGELAVHPPLLDLLSRSELLGRSFVFHHLHSDRRPCAGAGKSWHHDYEQPAGSGRRHPMVHALHYIHGLRPGMGALVVLPGSHREHLGKQARGHLGTDEIPGETLIDDLPPGSTVVLHSGLFHTRRPPAVPEAGPRYMIDASYCRTGALWPPVKPYWRQVLDVAHRRGLARERWPELFAERHFTEYVPAVRTGA
ncbi:phytanoyl-CoA dioxygenase family protein [Streptomyces sp. LS1784]|uniref:phytanoyl-CoA dioxygenase family protein n=1 Tax=Streptomyces sp. LS1784 TaxID=2851533 RepID=UPI001CCFCFF4|nr:phytanoyl-CoA dioxygenase family protein [Streptomyces sp. LS1784]